MRGAGLVPSNPIDSKLWLVRATMGLATLGLALRLIRYLQNFPLWCDETMLAANLLDRRWIDLARPLDYHQVCPLGFLALAWTAVRGLGFSEGSLRLVPLLGALASVPLFYLLARRVFGAATVGMLLAVGMFAVAQPPIRYAGEFKPYATDLFVATLLIWLALRWWESPGRVRGFWELAAVAPVAVALSLPSVFVIATIAVLGMLELVKTWQIRLALSYAVFLAAAGAGFGIMAALGQYQTTPADRAYFLNFWSQAFPPSLSNPSALLGWLWRTHTGPLFAYPYGPGRFPEWVNVPIVMCFLIGVWIRLRRDPGAVVLFVLPFLLALAASWLRRYPYGMSPRVSQFLVPATLILTASGLEWLLDRLRPIVFRVAVPGLVGLLIALGGWRFVVDLGRPYRSSGDRTAREFARWFWQEFNTDAETICVRARISEFRCVQSGGRMTASTSISAINESIRPDIIAACRRAGSQSRSVGRCAAFF